MSEEALERALNDELDRLDQHERITLNDDGTRTLRLTKPLPLFGHETTDVLKFKSELLVSDMEKSEKGKGEISQGAYLIAALANVDYSSIQKMRSADFKLAGLIVAKISGNEDPAIGGTS